MLRIWIVVALLLASLVFAGWASDFVTMQGERTVYSVDCKGGQWQGDHCTGTLVAGPRYRYRALKRRNEIVFWAAGVNEPSGKFTDCDVRDGRNWVCKPNADAARSVTLQMAEGVPVAGPTGVTRTARSISKWRWLLLKQGIGSGGRVPAMASAPSAA
ncbi:MAG: hypothetical protein ABI641_12055 [Caldimonas sp.]